jgi:hypothetical protein
MAKSSRPGTAGRVSLASSLSQVWSAVPLGEAGDDAIGLHGPGLGSRADGGAVAGLGEAGVAS